MTIGLWQMVLALAVSPSISTLLVETMCWNDENIGIALRRNFLMSGRFPGVPPNTV